MENNGFRLNGGGRVYLAQKETNLVTKWFVDMLHSNL